MDGFRDRLNGRYDRAERVDRHERTSERDHADYDRYDRGRRASSDSMDMGALSEVIDKSNREQMNAIADFFDEAKDDRLESEKVIVRAVDDNAQILNDIVKALKNMQDNNMSIGTQGESSQEEFFDSPSVEPSALNEILHAVADNKQLLTLIRQDVITINQNQAQAQATDTPAVVAEPTDAPDYLLAATADQYYKDMEEHVHKESVKCYRNMQAAITEQGGESVKAFTKSLTGIKVVSIISLVVSVLTMLLLAASIFQII